MVVTKFSGGDGPGQPGGQLNMLVASARDTRLMTVYSYTRLIVYTPEFKLQPDILESYENKDDKEFTLKLREGHKWSDGQPFTTEDFRFFWEDIANNKDLSPSGPSVELMVDGQPPKVEIIDRAHHQVHLGQAQPLLHREPGARRPAVPVPAGALPQEVPRQVRFGRGHRQGGQGRPEPAATGTQIYRRIDVMYANDNPDLPTLNPWSQHHGVAGAALSCSRAIPTTHRIDEQGAAAALCRPRDLHPGGDQPGAGQGRAGRGRPAAALSQHARLHLPAEERQELGRRGAHFGNRARARSSRSIPTSTPTTRSGAS